jgi:hypothetical protein
MLFEDLSLAVPLSVIKVIFFLIIAAFTITSTLALYSLVRYGKDKIIVTTVSVTYIIIATTLFLIAYNQVNNISFR